MRSFTRRRFLLGASAAGAAIILPSCGSAQGPESSGPLLVALFSRQAVLRPGVLQRVPMGLVDTGITVVGEYDELPARILKGSKVLQELTVAGRVVAHDHAPGEGDIEHQHSGLLRYLALRTVFPDAGVYDIEVDFGPDTASLPVQIFPTADQDLPGVGDQFPSLQTPTVEDPMNVVPLCSRAPEPCGLHGVNAADVIGTKPLAILFATPAFCATAYCGPVLDVLLQEMDAFANIEFIHVEVYENPRDVGGNYNDPAIEVARPLVELGLEFEPSLFLVDSAGQIVDRIDNVYDGTELRAALALLG